jgi:hypothetical protein
MKAFLAAVTAMILIAVGAHFTLDALHMSSAAVYQSDNVRLN